MPFVCHSYVIPMSLVCNRMSSVCHSYVLVCHPYVIRMYSYVIRMLLTCTRMSSVCHSYVLVCHPYVIRMYSYVTFYVSIPNRATHLNTIFQISAAIERNEGRSAREALINYFASKEGC